MKYKYRVSEKINEAVINIHRFADELDKKAIDIEKYDDPSIAAEAINTVTNMIMNCRLDIIVSNAIRDVQFPTKEV